MDRFNKVLIIIFGLLLLLVIAEGGYYFFSLQSKKSKIVNTPTPIVTNPSPITSPTIAPTISSTNTNGAIDPITLATIAQLKKSNVDSSILSLKMHGSISSKPSPDKKYKIRFIIMGNNQGTTDTIGFNDDRLSKTTVVKLIKDKETPININELKVGDYIEIEMTFDLTKPIETSLTQAKIIKRSE
ncbi:MAG: hypothetical protein Q7R95_01060 [bacterium]|nr:hypothetical protein [bacterium]